MKICIHRIWKLCYNLHPRLRNSPDEALNDIVDPIGCSQKILRYIICGLTNKSN